MAPILNAVRAAYAARLCILPVAADGSKRPDVATWTEFKAIRPTPAQMGAFDFGAREGYGMVAGPASAYVESWDFDEAETFHAFVKDAAESGLADVVARIRAGYEDQTPSGGVRWLVRYPEDVLWADCTLAKRPKRPEEMRHDRDKTKTLIEFPTFSILAPSNGSTHPSGRPYVHVSGGFDTIASYTEEERADLIALARALDQMAQPPRSHETGCRDGDRPGDDFNRRAAWEVILPDWTPVFARGETLYIRRPGKERGISATINYGGSDLLYVFSTSTEFEAGKSYSKFGAYARLHHADDYSAAACALAHQGYGRSRGGGQLLRVVHSAPAPARAGGKPAAPTDDKQRAEGTAPAIPSLAPGAAPLRTAALSDVDAVFERWLGEEYDFQALHAVLATAAAERLPGDPLWLLVVSGPGNAKTETVQTLAGAGAIVTSTISSEGALLSATARKERAEDATGGLLRKIGARGLLVLKDVTSILSMGRDTRAAVLAALREIHDGHWERNVGTDGGRSIAWSGRLVLVGAVTTAWDRAHDVVASMGDRFVLVRMDSTVGRLSAGRRACRNTGEEQRMRAELSTVVAAALRNVNPDGEILLSDAEREQVLQAANVVTLARTAVVHDYRGDVIDAHAPEAPTRFVKQLTQLVRGALALGLDRNQALALAIRCARDSMLPLRLAILDDVAAHPGSHTHEIRQRLDKPRATVDRQLQALHSLKVVTCEEEEDFYQGRPVTRWRYRLVPGINPTVLLESHVPDLSVDDHSHTGEHGQKGSGSLSTDISGTSSPATVDPEPPADQSTGLASGDPSEENRR